MNNNIQNTLHLSLKTKWFEMTKAGIKTEDYREINEYWIRRLTQCSTDLTEAKIELLKGGEYAVSKYPSLLDVPDYYLPKRFDINVMTLGYPKATDTERVLKFEHGGIVIRTGNPEWGAEPDKLYFVIIHGNVLDINRQNNR